MFTNATIDAELQQLTLYRKAAKVKPNNPELTTMRHLIGFSLLLITSISYAQIYTWKDAEGKTHYSDQAPTGAQIKKVKINAGQGTPSTAPAKQESLAEKEAAFKQRQMDKADAEKKAGEAAKDAEEKKAYCASLKGHLAGLKQSARLVEYSEDGKRKILGADARKAEIEKTEADIQKECSN